MKYRHTALVRFGALLLAAAAVLLMLPVFVAAQRPTVRVGYFSFDGYHMQDEEGLRSGYGYEFLQHMVGYTDWTLDYVGHDKSWSEMLEMLENGEIDLLTSAQKTLSRAERFAFSDQAIGTSSAILTTRAGDTTYLPKDYNGWNGMRVGMLESSSRNDDLAEFAARNGFSYVPVYYGDTEELVAALRQGDHIDAIVTSNLRRIENEWILAQFAPSPFYIIVQKENDALIEEVDQAISLVYDTEPGLAANLMDTWYGGDGERVLPFTADEWAFIAATRENPLTAILNPDRAPYSYLENGENTGILYSVAQEIIARSGLAVEFLPLETRGDYGAVLEQGDYHIRFDAGYDYAQAERLDLRLTTPYFEAPISRLTRMHTATVSTAALLAQGDIDRRYSAALEADGIAVTYYADSDAAVEAVLKGEQDAAYLYTSAAELAVEREPTNSLTAQRVYGYTTQYAVAVDGDMDPLLYSILQKTVSSLEEATLDRISQQYADHTPQRFSLRGYVYDNPIPVMLAVIALAVMAWLVGFSIQSARHRRREQLRSEQLTEALIAAKHADLSKSQFLSLMSHEIRTPLNAVIGYNTIARGELAADKDADNRARVDMMVLDCLVKSEIACKSLLSIINDILDMSAIESGKIQVVRERFDFKSLISSLTTLFYSQSKSKGVEFQVSFDAVPQEWFLGDQLRVSQVLANLLSNAVKFTPSGGAVKLTIFQSAEDADTARLCFEVSDTGIGMQEDFLAHIWDPFEQADASISRRFGGSGLGLTITKNLVELMGGDITVVSAPGAGTTFTVNLPFGRTNQPQSDDLFDFRRIRALVVDVDPAARSYVSLLFDRCGARCTVAASGAAGIQAFSEAAAGGEPFNTCIVDLDMPNTDGMETARQLRTLAEGERTVLILTAYDLNEAALQTQNLEGVRLMAKPIFPSALFDLLSTLRGSPSAPAAGAVKPHQFQGYRALLVEDHPMNLEIARHLLESTGLDLDCASNGQEAVDAFLSAPEGTYDIILMDVHMPVLDGYQATAAIRTSSHAQAAAIPIIAMTADAFSENVAEALAWGMNGHVAKPVDAATLFAVVAEHLAP